ncbi:MAG: ornithine cyclodeaminase family protein [Chloroflexi bacterium]|nr:ornithine cyclodeaminase family protein [Chloroflexota bacterium]
MPLLLKDSEVDRLITMDDALASVEEMFRELGQGRVSVFPRTKLRSPSGSLFVLGAANLYQGVMGAKCYTVMGHNYTFYVLLFDANDGNLLLIVRADRLGALRTGASTGVAAKHLARQGAEVVGVLGAGNQARTQLEAVCKVRPIRQAKVYAPTEEHRVRYAKEMGASLGIEARAVGSPRQAVEGSQIVLCMTNSSQPVFDGRWLGPGTLVTTAGNTRWWAQEVDETTVQRSDVVVADCLAQAQYEAGELTAAVERGVLRWGQVRELGHVVAGRAQGRTSEEQVVLYKAVGFGPLDVATAKLAYDRAREKGMGTQVEM